MGHGIATAHRGGLVIPKPTVPYTDVSSGAHCRHGVTSTSQRSSCGW